MKCNVKLFNSFLRSFLLLGLIGINTNNVYAGKIKSENEKAEVLEKIGVSCHGHQGGRDHMEDVYGFGQGLYFVCDGHNGDAAAQFVVENLPKNINFEAENMLDSIRQGILTTDAQYLKQEKINNLRTALDKDLAFNDQQAAGTTLTGILVHGKYIYVFNVGDSRTCIYGKDGKLLSKTTDHTVESESNRLKKAGGIVQGQRIRAYTGCTLAMGRAMGDRRLKKGADIFEHNLSGEINIKTIIGQLEQDVVIAEPDIFTVPLDEEIGFIIIGSDGLWDGIDNDKAGVIGLDCLYKDKSEEYLEKCKNNYKNVKHLYSNFASKILKNTSKIMSDFAFASSSDNITAMVVQLHWKNKNDFKNKEYLFDAKDFFSKEQNMSTVEEKQKYKTDEEKQNYKTEEEKFYEDFRKNWEQSAHKSGDSSDEEKEQQKQKDKKNKLRKQLEELEKKARKFEEDKQKLKEEKEFENLSDEEKKMRLKIKEAQKIKDAYEKRVKEKAKDEKKIKSEMHAHNKFGRYDEAEDLQMTLTEFDFPSLTSKTKKELMVLRNDLELSNNNNDPVAKILKEMNTNMVQKIMWMVKNKKYVQKN